MTARKPSQRTTRKRLGDCQCGDIVRYHAGYVVLFGKVASRSWVRWVDELSYREISEPFFLSPDTEVEVVRNGAERYPKQGGSEVDPLRSN